MSAEPKRPEAHAEFVSPTAAPRDAIQEALYNPIDADELKYYKMYPEKFKAYRDVIFDDQYLIKASEYILKLRGKLNSKSILTEEEHMVLKNFGSGKSAMEKLAKHLAAEAQAMQREKLIRAVGKAAELKEFQ